MGNMVYRCCGSCSSYDDGYCRCDDSGRFLDKVGKNQSACSYYFHWEIPESRRTGKPEKQERGQVGPYLCKTCGAYIPTGHRKCLACGSETSERPNTVSLPYGSGLTPPKPKGTPPAPELPKRNLVSLAEEEIREKYYKCKQKEDCVDFDMDKTEPRTVRIRLNGKVRTYVIGSADYYNYISSQYRPVETTIILRLREVPDKIDL